MRNNVTIVIRTYIQNDVSILKMLETIFYMLEIFKNKSNQIHAVSRTQQGRQREPSVKTLRPPLSAEFWRHCVLSGRTQRRA